MDRLMNRLTDRPIKDGTSSPPLVSLLPSKETVDLFPFYLFGDMDILNCAYNEKLKARSHGILSIKCVLL